MIRKFAPIALAIVGAVAAPAALAQSAGTWTLGFGAHSVNPTSDSGRIVNNSIPVNVRSSVRPTITAEYFVRDNLGIEAIAAWPFQHDIRIGDTRVASAKQLPPTVSLQYHFGEAIARPFIGAGVNYTGFFSEKAEGPLAGSKLALDNSWGLAVHAGIDFSISERSAIRTDVRWIDIDTDVTLNGAKVGTVAIDPLVYGAAYVLEF